MLLNESGHAVLDFTISIQDENFDNDDNPYGKFVYHMYTNMDNITDNSTSNISGDFYDIEIPLVKCTNLSSAIAWKSSTINEYCPDFT